VSFTLISDARVTSIPVIECGDRLIDSSDSTVLAVSGKRASSNPWYSFVRRDVLTRLERAAQRLPRGVHLCIEEGFRTVAHQQILFADYLAKLEASDPSLRNGRLLAEAMKYVAPPDEGPPHTTGGAIDVALLDSTGVELDMGSTSDDTPLDNGTANFTHCRALPPAALRHRMILVDAMTEAGFVNYPAEWWHWSYGDRYWAYCTSTKAAIFGALAVDVGHPFPNASRSQRS
jgi:D-alanyl-D-alanine dipeptidase